MRTEQDNSYHIINRRKSTICCFVESTGHNFDVPSLRYILLLWSARNLVGCKSCAVPFRSKICSLPALGLTPFLTMHFNRVVNSSLNETFYTSGSSAHQKTCISKAGNRRLRRALHRPAPGTIVREPHLRAFYRHLLAGGKTQMQSELCTLLFRAIAATMGPRNGS
jgi:hypothetical protein